MEELHALHAQLAGIDKNLGDRLERIEAALLGDDDLGLQGMVERVKRLDRESRDATAQHDQMEERRREGDARLHERIDDLEGFKKYVVGAIVGASMASAGGAVGLMQLLT